MSGPKILKEGSPNWAIEKLRQFAYFDGKVGISEKDISGVPKKTLKDALSKLDKPLEHFLFDPKNGLQKSIRDTYKTTYKLTPIIHSSYRLQLDQERLPKDSNLILGSLVFKLENELPENHRNKFIGLLQRRLRQKGIKLQKQELLVRREFETDQSNKISTCITFEISLGKPLFPNTRLWNWKANKPKQRRSDEREFLTNSVLNHAKAALAGATPDDISQTLTVTSGSKTYTIQVPEVYIAEMKNGHGEKGLRRYLEKQTMPKGATVDDFVKAAKSTKRLTASR